MILVSGSLAYDYIMDFPGYFRDHILPEKLHVLSVSFLIDKMERNFGGTAGNIAYNLALLGERPTILASAGNDFEEYGKWLSRSGTESNRKVGQPSSRLDSNRVDLSCVRRVPDVPTASCYITTDKADNQIAAFYPGAMSQSIKAELFFRQSSALKFRQVKLAIVAPGNVEDMKRLPALYKKHRVPYVYDPGQNIPSLSGAQLRAGIAGAKVFISNDYELAMVLKKTGWTKQDVLKRVEVLVTTLGEKGSVIEASPHIVIPRSHEATRNPVAKRTGSFDSLRSLRMTKTRFVIPPAKPRNTSDPTGAGDAYRAGFIKGLLMDLPYDKVGKLASVVAVYTVEKYGTQTHAFTWQGLLRRYRENFKESLM